MQGCKFRSENEQAVRGFIRAEAASIPRRTFPLNGESHVRLTYYFFFQAEDGIRDYKVTGVQTCALPILNKSITVPFSGSRAFHQCLETRNFTQLEPDSKERKVYCPNVGFVESDAIKGRSEERRVGKECRSRWSPYH